ncbi:MAG: hypothetical protein JSR67_12025 [Proteobacteria bacterium]|nr:hypothetical protein [Pseudomonadota bacterium]
MNVLTSTKDKATVRPAPLRDCDDAYGCVEWYVYPKAVAESPAADPIVGPHHLPRLKHAGLIEHPAPIL